MIAHLPTVPKARVFTHGCRLNQSESLQLMDNLVARGYSLSDKDEPLDLAIINTCTVTQEAEAKCRQTIRKTIRENPSAYVAVIGCYSQMGAKRLSRIHGVDLIIGNHNKLSVLDYVESGKNDQPLIVRDKIDSQDFTIRFPGEIPFNQRANLKVQDGCDFMCSFCIIPFARGRARSRDFHNTLDEARSLVQRGVRELVLTGVNIGTYDNSGYGIVELVDELANLQQLHRIRISSIEPTTVPFTLLDRMADDSHPLMPYLHLPLQSGCDRILHAMRRKYSVSEYTGFVREAVSRVPGLCLGTDIMVGFPGETAEDFEETCDYFSAQPFAYCHVFPYSERKGTLVMKQEVEFVPVPERQRRAVTLRRLSARQRREHHAQYLGQVMEVLFENPREGLWPGYTGNYIRVAASSREDIRNRRAHVRLIRQTADFVEAEIIRVLD